MKRNCFARFEYLTTMNDSQKASFLHVMEMLILNMDIRFPCPAFSLETSLAKRHTDQTSNTLQPAFYKRMQMKCPFAMEVDLFFFPDQFIKCRQINPWFLRQFSEMELLMKEIVENERMVVKKTTASKQDGQDVKDSIIDLSDVFKCVDKGKYPELWDIFLRTMTYIPTSVSCEQSFSILKRRLHENMKKENAFMFVQMAKRTKEIEL